MEKSTQEIVAKKKTGRKTLTETQDRFCKLVVTEGMKPLDAMLEVFPNRRTYSIGNQKMLVKKMVNNQKIQDRMKELFSEIRDNEVLGDMYNFEKGVRILNEEIRLAQAKIEEGHFTESIHRIILTSVQELNRMYGFNVVDRKGNMGQTVNITFVDVDKPKKGMIINESK